MALAIQHRKKDNKYRAWSTIVDDWLTRFLTRNQMVKYLQSRVLRRANDECEEIAVSFPNGYWDRNGKRFWDDELAEKHQKLLQSRIKR